MKIDPELKTMLRWMFWSWLILFVVFGVLSSIGCCSTYVKTEKWTCYRLSLGYNAQMPKLSMSPAGTVKLEGYGGEVDEELLTAVQKALIALGVK